MINLCCVKEDEMKYTTKELVCRWEDQRDIKNLMGKYSNCIILNREHQIVPMFWAQRDENVCLALNDGYYKGKAAVEAYYSAAYERNKLVASLLKKRFPEELGDMSDEDVYGIGPFKVKPMACPVIEIAEDGKTAKGLWYCQGAYSEVEASGPVAHWTWGYFAVDFVREEEDWKILHMMHFNDVDAITGQSWGKPQTAYPDLPEFIELKNFEYPAYTKAEELYPIYTLRRSLPKTPGIPEPYRTFSETFSYGF